MKKLYTLFGIVIGAGLMFGGYAVAREVPDVPAFVDIIKRPDNYGVDVYKMYDPYANVVCYVTGWAANGAGNDISCVSLK